MKAWHISGRTVIGVIGCPVVDGPAMLIYQGAEAIAFRTGRSAPVSVMEEMLTAYFFRKCCD